MSIVWTFLKNNWKFIVIVILFLLALVMGIVLGKKIIEDRQARTQEQETKRLLKLYDDSIVSFNKQIPLLQDSIYILRASAEIADSQAKEIHKETKKIYENTNKEVAHVMQLSRDSTAILFAKLSEEYLKNARRQPKGSDSIR